MTPTVACVWVRGNVPYGAEYVTRLRSMVLRHLAGPHRFVCLTDRPGELPGVECLTAAPTMPLPGWWAKVQLFNPLLDLGGRVLYLDLDVIITGDLGDILDYREGMVLAAPGGNFAGRAPLRTVRRFNSSVMSWWAGAHAELYYDWRPDIAQHLWGDQDWIGQHLLSGTTLPVEWTPRISELGDDPPPAGVRVVLCKRPKNAEAARRWPWVRELWQ